MTKSKVSREWLRFSGENLLLVGVVTLIVLLAQILNMESGEMTAVLRVVPFLLCLTTLIGMTISEFSRHAAMLPLMLSMNNTRRSVYAWSYICRALSVLMVVLIGAVIFGVSGEGGAGELLTITCLILSGMSIISLLCCFHGTRYQWIATVGVMICAGGLGGVVGGNLAGGDIGEFTQVFILAVGQLGVKLWGATAVLVVIDMTVNWLAIRRREVKL